MGSAASAARPRAAERYSMEDVRDTVERCLIPAVAKADHRLQSQRVFTYDADEWEEAFGQTCRELMAKDDSEDDQRQDSPVFTQDDSD